MGCPKVEEESHAYSPSVSSALNEALLWATLCIIGLPVYVHVKDGSVYSGIFYTASVENDFGIVLKNAKLTKKGTSKTNVPSGSVVETLVIHSSNIVQVIAKGVSLPSNLSINSEGENVESAMATVSYEPPATEAKESTKCGMEGRHVSHRRIFVRTETHSVDEVRTIKSGKDQEGWNPLPDCVPKAIEAGRERRDGIELTMNEDHHSFLMDERKAGACILGHNEQNPNIHQEDNIDVQSSSSSWGSTSEQVRPIEEDKMTSKPLGNGVCYDAAERPTSTDNLSSRSTIAEESSASCQDSVASSNGSISPKTTETEKRTKEFKLNPGAKIFSPSFTKLVSPTPAGMLSAGNMAYLPSNTPMLPVPEAIQPEAGVSPFVPHATPPSKFAPHSNLMAGIGGTGSQFSQPIIGPTGNRAQPLRYSSQYHPVQAATMLVNPNPQVMVGRMGQLVYVQPVSQDVVQGAPPLAPLPSRPLLTTQQVQYPKHQGGPVGSQPYQLCVPQPLVASGQQQPYAMPAHVPVLQPPFPSPNGFFGPKFP